LLITQSDITRAEHHAERNKMPLVDAVVVPGQIAEAASYATLAAAGGFEFVDLDHAASSELALRLVPDRVAHRHLAVPLKVDNRTLTYATSQPFSGEADQDIAFANDIRAAMRSEKTATMREHAMQLVVDGVTSIEEVLRVLSADVDGAQAVRSHTRSRVLVADDEPITRMLVKLLLEREHFEVLEAANGRQAVDIAARERPDLMIIDLNMPEMDGYEAIGRLRRDIRTATLPIMVLTSEEGPAVERRVLTLGADDYIIKPFDPDVLLTRVKGVFRRLKVMAA
jgi:CheY-like chemotaxis protein